MKEQEKKRIVYYTNQLRVIKSNLGTNFQKIIDEIKDEGTFANLKRLAEPYKITPLDQNEIYAIATERTTTYLGYKSQAHIQYFIEYIKYGDITDEEKQAKFTNLENILNAGKVNLDVDWILQGTTIQLHLSNYASFYRAQPECFLLAFLTAYASALPKKLYYNFNLAGTVIPSLFMLFIGKATAGKSIITDPFANAVKDRSVEIIKANNDKKKDYGPTLS